MSTKQISVHHSPFVLGFLTNVIKVLSDVVSIFRPSLRLHFRNLILAPSTTNLLVIVNVIDGRFRLYEQLPADAFRDFVGFYPMKASRGESTFVLQHPDAVGSSLNGANVNGVIGVSTSAVLQRCRQIGAIDGVVVDDKISVSFRHFLVVELYVTVEMSKMYFTIHKPCFKFLFLQYNCQ